MDGARTTPTRNGTTGSDPARGNVSARPARPAPSRAVRRMALRERSLDLVRDPASGVEVSLYDEDGPSAAHRRHARFETALIAETDPQSGRAEIRRVTRKIDTVALLVRAGKLDDAGKSAAWNERRREAVLAAARRFRDDFDRAHLDPLRAADLTRIPGQKTREADAALAAAEAAKARLWRALGRLGGSGESPLGAPLAAAAWFVIGAGLSISDFARRQRWGRGAGMSRKTAEALVVGALAVLAA
ncbi:MAG TPA: hypothetical protein VKY65_14210 [Alphaproteobacteria bacterium]|nr:hypothetical protein [Alphaproteobacteria bacterium]